MKNNEKLHNKLEKDKRGEKLQEKEVLASSCKEIKSREINSFVFVVGVPVIEIRGSQQPAKIPLWKRKGKEREEVDCFQVEYSIAYMQLFFSADVSKVAIRSARRKKDSRFLSGLSVRNTNFALVDANRTV